MDDHRLFVWVVVENDDFEKASGSVRPDNEGPPFASDESDRVADRMGDVLVRDTMLAGAVRDLHMTR